MQIGPINLIRFVLDCIMRLKYRFCILAHEGRLLEAIPKMERGVASRGAGSQPSPREAPGPRPPGTTTWLRGARCTDPAQMPEKEARDRSPKSPRWSAERRASPERRKAPR